jgi:hypothetical protein
MRFAQGRSNTTQFFGYSLPTTRALPLATHQMIFRRLPRLRSPCGSLSS